MDPSVVLTSTFAFFFRALVAQPFAIPSGAMMPTLEVGDYAVATKFSYGYNNFSLPLGEMFPEFAYARTQARRGDVVIFRLPDDRSIDYVMRIVGLPGDTIQMKAGITYLNGIALKREAAGRYRSADQESRAYHDAPLFREFTPDGISYTVLELMDGAQGDDTKTFSVPPDHYFVMGDNRDNSNDSRFSVGYVPAANVYAKVVVAVSWPDGKFTKRDVK